MHSRGKNAVVVLGAAVWENGIPSPTLKRRAVFGAAVQRELGSIIIGSGGLGKFPPSEAEVMRDIFLANGVSHEQILLESQSTTTFENIRNSEAIGAALGIQHYIIVTDFYHAPRARITGWFLGIECSTRTPPTTTGTSNGKLLKAVLREAVALPFYMIKLAFSKHPDG